jgi:integrase
VFASEWLAAREAEGLAPKTIVDLRWSLSNHLLAFFKDHRLSEITVQEVDRFKVAKVRERQLLDEARARGEKVSERGLSNPSVNHVLSDLAQVLEIAVEYGLIASNPAAGKRRRLKSARPSRPWVEPEQLMAFLDAAPKGVGRTLLAILAGAGLRIGEALALRWRDVDRGTGTLYIRDAKTAKGIREVHLSLALREELTLRRADADRIEPDDYVIGTATGRQHNPSNLRRDVLAKTVAAANMKLAALGIAPIESLTFHGLRRTYASLRCVCGDDVRYTADQLGDEDPRFTLRCFAQASKRRDRLARPQRQAFDAAIQWPAMGTTAPETIGVFDTQATKSPV